MTKHKSVLLQEIIETLKVKPGGLYADVTLGGGGHSDKILAGLDSRGTLVAFDQDKEAINNFRERCIANGFKQVNKDLLQKDSLKVYLIQSNFRNFSQKAAELDLKGFDGIIADLGMSTDQLNSLGRGFSFMRNEELDMRMSDTLKLKAKDFLNALYKAELVELFRRYADIDYAPRLANEIIRFRNTKLIETTFDLKQIIQKIVPSGSRSGTKRQPEARVFQALRIAVNDELNSLDEFLPQGFEALGALGRMEIITFHSGENKLVKKFNNNLVNQGLALIILEDITPSKEEMQANPQSRSARLQAIKKLKTAHDTIQTKATTK